MQDSQFSIQMIACRKDNYAFILINHNDNSCYVIDTPDGDKICEWIKQNNLYLRGVLNTHHHHDHVGGNMVLKEAFECLVYGAEKDQERIIGITNTVKECGKIELFDGLLEGEIIGLDGHTIGLIGFYFQQIESVFLGDALFNLGCGYMFEGTQEQMWSSMQKIRSLPDNTKIYAAHEYSLKNAEFVEHIMPYNKKRELYIETLKQKRNLGAFTIPTFLEDQKEFNPFLQADSEAVKKVTNTRHKTDAETFGALRALKNQFS